MSKTMHNNAMMVLVPYKHNGTWVFDDDKTGLVREPFVAGIPEMIDLCVTGAEIKNPEKGFRLTFSENPFPGYHAKLDWMRAEHGGNWYQLTEIYEKNRGDGKEIRWEVLHQMEGWLCPNLYKYFKEAPKNIYMKAESIDDTTLMAVYGTLRKGGYYYDKYRLDKSEYLGIIWADGFDMFDLGHYPGITYGKGKVLFEIYRVNKKIAAEITRMETASNYKEDSIITKNGNALIYVREEGSIYTDRKVESGDWVSYLKERRK